MLIEELIIRGMLMGVSHLTDYNSKENIGVKLDLGSRNDSGRFITQSIKVMGAKTSDFIQSLDEVVSIQLQNITISCYMAGNRPALSIKASIATILEG